MNAPKTPSKKKAMTEKQYAQIMTKRRACIQKFRETMKKTLKASKKKSTEPVVIQERVPKKRVSKKKNIVSVLSESAVPAVPAVPDVPVKRQRVSKKKKEPLEEPLEEIQAVEEKVVKKRTNKKKPEELEELEEPLEEPLEEEEKVVKKRVYKKKAKEPLEE